MHAALQEAVPEKGNPEATINLVSFGPIAPLHSSATPFGAKIEILLRLAALPYRANRGDITDTKTSPKSKVPPQSRRAFFSTVKFYAQQTIVLWLHAVSGSLAWRKCRAGLERRR